MISVGLDRTPHPDARPIVSVEITKGPGPLPHGIFEQSPRVIATLEDGTIVDLFSYYAHERSFTAADFSGLTVDEGRALKFRKEHALAG